jgi:hypothetical protein
MAVRNFEDLNVWKQARQLTQEVYRLTRTEKLGFRSAGSDSTGGDLSHVKYRRGI